MLTVGLWRRNCPASDGFNLCLRACSKGVTQQLDNERCHYVMLEGLMVLLQRKNVWSECVLHIRFAEQGISGNYSLMLRLILQRKWSPIFAGLGHPCQRSFAGRGCDGAKGGCTTRSAARRIEL